MAKRTYIKWTEEEQTALLDLIKQHPENLREAFRIHSENTGRSEHTILQYFFKYRKKNGFDIGSLKKWTKKEEAALLKLIEAHPNNFEDAYRIHAENYNRTTEAVRDYFYRYRKQEDAKVCMIVVGKNKRNSPNRKNINANTHGETVKVKQSKWRRILDILFE